MLGAKPKQSEQSSVFQVQEHYNLAVSLREGSVPTSIPEQSRGSCRSCHTSGVRASYNILYTYIFPQFLIYYARFKVGYWTYVNCNPGPLPDLLVWHSTVPICIQDLRAPGNGRDCVMGNVSSFLNLPIKLFFLAATWGHPVPAFF